MSKIKELYEILIEKYIESREEINALLDTRINNRNKQLRVDIDESSTLIEDTEVEKDEMLKYERKASGNAEEESDPPFN